MQRISEKRKKVMTTNILNINNSYNEDFYNIKTDILYHIRHYDSRILFYNKETDSRNCKNYLKNSLVYREKIPFDIKIDFYKNLRHIVFKSTIKVDFNYFINTNIKSIELNRVSQIIISPYIKIKELRLLNCTIPENTFMEILQISTLVSLTLKNVIIYNKVQTPKITTFYNSDSEEETNVLEDTNDNEINTYYEDYINSKICKLLESKSLKKLTLINTNIYFNTVKQSGLLQKINIFKFKDKFKYFYTSFSHTVCSYLQTNLEDIFTKDIEHLSITNTKVLLQDHNFEFIKRLDIINSNITSDIVDILISKLSNTYEFSFKCCIFVGISFVKFIYAFRKNIRHLNLSDSDLPIDSLTELKKTLVDCKVIFRNQTIFYCKNI